MFAGHEISEQCSGMDLNAESLQTLSAFLGKSITYTCKK